MLSTVNISQCANQREPSGSPQLRALAAAISPGGSSALHTTVAEKDSASQLHTLQGGDFHTATGHAGSVRSITCRRTSHVARSDIPAHENSIHSVGANRAVRASTNWRLSPSKNVPWVRSRIPDCCRDERTSLAHCAAKRWSRARQRNLSLALHPRATRLSHPVCCLRPLAAAAGRSS